MPGHAVEHGRRVPADELSLHHSVRIAYGPVPRRAPDVPFGTDGLRTGARERGARLGNLGGGYGAGARFRDFAHVLDPFGQIFGAHPRGHAFLHEFRHLVGGMGHDAFDEPDVFGDAVLHRVPDAGRSKKNAHVDPRPCRLAQERIAVFPIDRGQHGRGRLRGPRPDELGVLTQGLFRLFGFCRSQRRSDALRDRSELPLIRPFRRAGGDEGRGRVPDFQAIRKRPRHRPFSHYRLPSARTCRYPREEAGPGLPFRLARCLRP